VPAARRTVAHRPAALPRPSRGTRLLLVGAAAAGLWLLSGLSHSAEAASPGSAALPASTVSNQLASLPAGRPPGGLAAGPARTSHSTASVAGSVSSRIRRLAGALPPAASRPAGLRAPTPLPIKLPAAGSLPAPIALPTTGQLPVPIVLPVPIALPNAGQLPVPIALPSPGQLPVPILLPIPSQLPISNRPSGLPAGGQRVPVRSLPAGPAWPADEARPAGWRPAPAQARAVAARPAPSPAPRPQPAPGSPNGLAGAGASGRTEAPRPLPVVVLPGRAPAGSPAGLAERRPADLVAAHARGCRPDVSPD